MLILWTTAMPLEISNNKIFMLIYNLRAKSCNNPLGFQISHLLLESIHIPFKQQPLLHPIWQHPIQLYISQVKSSQSYGLEEVQDSWLSSCNQYIPVSRHASHHPSPPDQVYQTETAKSCMWREVNRYWIKWHNGCYWSMRWIWWRCPTIERSRQSSSVMCG